MPSRRAAIRCHLQPREIMAGLLDRAKALLQKPASLPAIRRLAREQAEECAALHAVSFAHPWSQTEFEGLIDAREVLCHAAMDDRSRKLLGMIFSRIAADEAEILTIAVDPSDRQSGIGTKLLSRQIAELAALRVTSLFLEVDENNGAARALYTRLGFKIVGERKAYYRTADGGRATALVMRLDL